MVIWGWGVGGGRSMCIGEVKNTNRKDVFVSKELFRQDQE